MLRSFISDAKEARGSGAGGLLFRIFPGADSLHHQACRRIWNEAERGSDFHGENRPEAPLGCVKVPYSLLEELKNG
jgi:hypothetical protein